MWIWQNHELDIGRQIYGVKWWWVDNDVRWWCKMMLWLLKTNDVKWCMTNDVLVF
jgi:hypothetical protein